MQTHPIQFGLQTGQQNVAWQDLLDLWKRAEQWGYDSLWNFDHFYPIFTDPTGPCLEGWTTLSALAQATERVRIGHLVNGNTYRHPSVTAKMAMSLDHISGGRLNLGLGAGWFELEHESLGIEFKTVRGRLEALEEACRIIKGMFAGDAVTLDGKHYSVKDARCVPAPVQDGGPPLLIGGAGPKILLRIVAEYADMWNYRGSPETMRSLVDIIRSHGDRVGRDTDVIEKSVMLPLLYTDDREQQSMMVELMAAVFETSPEEARRAMMIGTRDECLEHISTYKDAGITHFIFMSMTPYATDQMQAFAEEVIPQAHAL